jgi:hypothetical protein
MAAGIVSLKHRGDWYNTKSVEVCTDRNSIAYEVMFTPRLPLATLQGSADHAREDLRWGSSAAA